MDTEKDKKVDKETLSGHLSNLRGSIAGLELLLTLHIGNSSTNTDIKFYIETILVAEKNARESIDSNEHDGVPLDYLDGLLEKITNMKSAMLRLLELREGGINE